MNTEYQYYILVPRLINHPEVNPVKLMSFSEKPIIDLGEETTLKYPPEVANGIYFKARLAKITDNYTKYIFEIVDKNLALEIAYRYIENPALAFLNLILQRYDIQEEIKTASKTNDIYVIAHKHELRLKNISQLANTIVSLEKKAEKEFIVLSSEEKFALDALKYFPQNILIELREYRHNTRNQ